MQVLSSVVRTPRSLVPDTEKREFLALLCGAGTDILPERFGFWEPLRDPFDCEAKDEPLRMWQASHFALFVTRTRPRVDIDARPAWGGPAPSHADVTVLAESGNAVLPSVMKFNLAVAEAFRADLSLIHVPPNEDDEVGALTRTVSCYGSTGKRHVYVSTYCLRRYIPDLYWATIFGPPYIKLFGEERLLSAPAPVVRRLKYGAVYIQLSDSPYDFISDYARLDAVRREVKAYLGNNAFYDPELPSYHRYAVPDFHLDSERYRARPEIAS